MTKKEVKEVNMESIKNEIVDKLKDNFDILQYLSNSAYTTHNSQTVSGIVSSIFNYGIETAGNYITVEAEEHEFTSCDPNDHKRYKIIIKMGLEKEKDLDSLAALVKEVIAELYPNRKNYSNVPFYRKEERHTHETLNRMITFEIETDTYMK